MGKNIINFQEKAAGNIPKKSKAVRKSKKTLQTITPEGRYAWFNALFENDVDTVKSMIKAWPDILHMRNHAGTALHLAVKYEHIEMVECLLKADADANAVDEDGDFVLATAARKGNAGIVSALLPFVDNVDIRSEGGCFTPLIWAISFGHVSVAKVLLDAGADIEAKHFQSPSITGALLCDHAEVIKLLIQRGADMEGICYNGNTVLGEAAESGSFHSLSILLENGANIHTKQRHGQSLLALALNKTYCSIGRDDKCIRALVDVGARVTPEENQQYPFLCDAIEKKYPADLIHKLIKHGLDVNKPNKDGEAPIELVIASDSKTNPDRSQLVKWLLDAGVNLNVKNKYGDTPLHNAISRRETNFIQQLLRNGADVSIPNAKGETALTLLANGNFHFFSLPKDVQ